MVYTHFENILVPEDNPKKSYTNKYQKHIPCKSWNIWRTHYINMVDKGRKLYERNGRKTIVDNDGILWFNEKYIEEGLDYKNLREIARKYNSNHRKLRYELLGEPKNNAI